MHAHEHAGSVAELVGLCDKLKDQWTCWFDVWHQTGHVQLNTQCQNPKMSCVLFIPSPCQNRRMFIGRITECLKITVLARIIECLEIKIVSAVTWISLSIKFVVMRQRWKRNPRQTVPWPATGITQNKVLVVTDWLLLVFNAWLTDYSCISLWLHLQLLQWLRLCITVHATLYSNNKWM